MTDGDGKIVEELLPPHPDHAIEHPPHLFPPPDSNKVERAPAWLALVFIGGITLGAIAALSATVLIPLIFGVEPIPDGAAVSTMSDVILLGIGAIAGVLGTGGAR